MQYFLYKRKEIPGLPDSYNSKDVIVIFNKNAEVVAIEILHVKDTNHIIDLPIVLKSP